MRVLLACARSAEIYNDTVEAMGEQPGDCPSQLAGGPCKLNAKRLLETSFKWMLRGQVEWLGRLHELSLGGMDIKDVDAVLNDTWNDSLQLAFTDEWGARHHSAVPGGCAIARLTLAGCCLPCLPCGYLRAVVRSCGVAWARPFHPSDG